MDVYLTTEGVRDLYEAVSRLSDVTVLEPLHVQPNGQTEFVVKDPKGYTLVFSELM